MSYTPQTPSGLSSPNRPCLLIPPNLLNHQSPERVQSSISAIISGLAFCDLYQAATNSGKARLLDGASPLGPSTWLTRMPKSTRFRFLESGIDPISARAADLLACPPHLLHKHCFSCSYHTSPTLQPLDDDARHFVRCPKGLRLDIYMPTNSGNLFIYLFVITLHLSIYIHIEMLCKHSHSQ